MGDLFDDMLKGVTGTYDLGNGMFLRTSIKSADASDDDEGSLSSEESYIKMLIDDRRKEKLREAENKLNSEKGRTASLKKCAEQLKAEKNNKINAVIQKYDVQINEAKEEINTKKAKLEQICQTKIEKEEQRKKTFFLNIKLKNSLMDEINLLGIEVSTLTKRIAELEISITNLSNSKNNEISGIDIEINNAEKELEANQKAVDEAENEISKCKDQDSVSRSDLKNAVDMMKIYEAMEEMDGYSSTPRTPDEIMESYMLRGMDSSRVRSLLTRMKNSGAIVRTEFKKRAYYEIAEGSDKYDVIKGL